MKHRFVLLSSQPCLDLPAASTQQEVVEAILRTCGNTEETAWLLDWLQDLWETRDILCARFGEEQTLRILLASWETTAQLVRPIESDEQRERERRKR